MGAWSKDSFGNDTANDWAYDLIETANLNVVRKTIQRVLDSGHEYLKARDAEKVIAAVEVIARLQGNFGKRDAYTEKVDNWVKTHPQPPPSDLIMSGSQALDRVLQPPSELLELWQESDEFEGWKNSVLDLKRRAAG
jgi:Domain of unknown function (DUF4259)